MKEVKLSSDSVIYFANDEYNYNNKIFKKIVHRADLLMGTHENEVDLAADDSSIVASNQTSENADAISASAINSPLIPPFFTQKVAFFDERRSLTSFGYLCEIFFNAKFLLNSRLRITHKPCPTKKMIEGLEHMENLNIPTDGKVEIQNNMLNLINFNHKFKSWGSI